MSALRTKLDSLIAKTDLEVSEQQREQLVGYVELLDKWNKAYNLTSVRDPLDMLVKHILDSIVVSTHLPGERFIDVGVATRRGEFAPSEVAEGLVGYHKSMRSKQVSR